MVESQEACHWSNLLSPLQPRAYWWVSRERKPALLLLLTFHYEPHLLWFFLLPPVLNLAPVLPRICPLDGFQAEKSQKPYRYFMCIKHVFAPKDPPVFGKPDAWKTPTETQPALGRRSAASQHKAHGKTAEMGGSSLKWVEKVLAEQTVFLQNILAENQSSVSSEDRKGSSPSWIMTLASLQVWQLCHNIWASRKLHTAKLQRARLFCLRRQDWQQPHTGTDGSEKGPPCLNCAQRYPDP